MDNMREYYKKEARHRENKKAWHEKDRNTERQSDRNNSLRYFLNLMFLG